MKTLILLFTLLACVMTAQEQRPTELKTWGDAKTQTLISVQTFIDSGEPNLDSLKPARPPEPPIAPWEPPTLVPVVKKPQPQVAANQKAEPTLVWFADRVERDWFVVEIPGPTEAELKGLEAKKEAARVSKEQAAKLTALYAPYRVEPEGFSLATREEDQNAFTRLLTLLSVAGAPNETPTSISDSSGTLHEVTFGRLKQILVAYGLEVQRRWVAFKSK